MEPRIGKEQEEVLRSIALSARRQASASGPATRAAGATPRTAVTALFVGSDRTVLTKAAEVLARNVGRDLYRVDLSQVVNKHVGETQENLSRVFDEAERAGRVLFFDEADALFGKRTDVKDSHDRYANIDTSYLLERIEAFKGLAILATNRKGSLDDAFTRRIQHVVSFPDG